MVLHVGCFIVFRQARSLYRAIMSYVTLAVVSSGLKACQIWSCIIVHSWFKIVVINYGEKIGKFAFLAHSSFFLNIMQL
jgi:hypothetical protein